MAMGTKRLNERKTFERDLDELISFLDRFYPVINDDAGKTIGYAINDVEACAELQRMAVTKGLLSKKELALRQERHAALGRPALNSPEWLAELERIRKLFPRKPRAPRGTSSINTDPNDLSSLYWQLLMLTARKARGEQVWPILLPSQSGRGEWCGLQGELPPQILTSTDQKRLSRWLWRHAARLLNATDNELHEQMQGAGVEPKQNDGTA